MRLIANVGSGFDRIKQRNADLEAYAEPRSIEELDVDDKGRQKKPAVSLLHQTRLSQVTDICL